MVRNTNGNDGAAMLADSASASGGDQSQPRYQQIVEAIRNDIQGRKYKEGDQLPSEAELRETYGVSRHTIREALRALKERGYLESRQGAATRIARRDRPLYTYSVNDVAELIQYATDARYEIDKTSIVTADAALAATLSCEVGSRWLRVEGYRYANGDPEPLCWTEVYILSEYSGVAVMIGRQPGTIYSFIESMYGVRVHQVEQALYGGRMPDDAAILKGDAEDVQAIVIRRTYRLQDGIVPQVAINYHSPDRLRLNWTLHRAAGQ